MSERPLGPLLLASVPGNGGGPGGVFAVGQDGCELLDPIPTTGMAVSPDGSQLARLSWIDGHTERSELLVSDGQGLLTYRRLDEVEEPHSLLWRGDELIAVSTGSNRVLTLDVTGRTLRRWNAPNVAGMGDCWHLNSLVAVGDRLLVSAFGKFDEVRGWSRPDALDGAGIVLDLETGETVLEGLSAPHDPTWLGDGWLLCNSFTGELCRLDVAGVIISSVQLNGWTRGILIDGDVAYVGVSSHRLAGPLERARIAVLDLSTLREVSEIQLPSRDVFALCHYDEHLDRGLRVGINQGSGRYLGSPSVVMNAPLRPEDCRTQLTLVATSSSTATVRITNRAMATWSSFGKHPVRVGARWWDESAGVWIELHRSELSSPLYPGSSETVHLEFPSLPPPGTPIQIGVLQEMVRWFDEVDSEASIDIWPEY